MRGGHLTKARQFTKALIDRSMVFQKKKRSPTSNGNTTNVCLLLTYLSRIKGKQSTRRLIVKQNFAGTINVFISQRKSPGNTPAFDSAHVIQKMAVHIRFLPHPVTNDTLKLYNIHLRPSSVADPGEEPRGSDPPLLSDETGAKLFFGDRPTLPPPPILGSE